MTRGKSIAAGLLLAAAVLAIRLVNLSADPPSGLSWSSGIYTDEGFYAADARQVTLTGHWSPGNFHGALLSPVLYWLQLAVFHCARPSLVAARMISVVCGAITVWLLFVALRRLYGERTAWLGAVLLGFSPMCVHYNRLALMETPAAMLMTAAIACLAYCSRSTTDEQINGTDGDRMPVEWRAEGWLAALGGVLFGLALVAKILLLPVIAVPVIWAVTIKRPAVVAKFAAGAAVPIVLTQALWLGPFAEQLRAMQHYYWSHQFSPHSLQGLGENLARAWFTGKGDGLLHAFGKVDPVMLGLGLLATINALAKRTEADRLMLGWLISMVVALSCLSYTPTRYDVMFLPALVGITARGIESLNKLSIVFVMAFVGLCQAYILAPMVKGNARTIQSGSRRLAKTAPSDSVVVGQLAPELCMDTHLTPVMVQPGLANDDHPVERFGASYVLVTRSPYWNKWWSDRYPSVIMSSNRVDTLSVGPSMIVDVYSVPLAIRSEVKHGL